MPENRLYSDFQPVSYEVWKESAEKALKGAPFDSKMLTKTYEEITLKPVYRAADVQTADSMPGSAPFLRGATVDGYLRSPWLVAQECDQASASDLNSTLKAELARGLQMAHIKLDSASKFCSVPDEKNAGDKGFSLINLEDLKQALGGIDLSKLPVRIDAGVSAVPLLGALANTVKNIKGCVGADPLAVLAENGALPASFADIYAQMAESIKWAGANAPELRTVIVDTAVYNNAGANAVQELAFAAATFVEYADKLAEQGISFADAAKRTQFAFSVSANLFMEISKLRAMRLIFSRICAAYGLQDAAPDIHARTSFFTMTKYDPYVNMLRATTESFAAAVGGVSSIHVGGFDEAVRKGDEFSRRVARNTQTLLQNEYEILASIDPAGGSWYIEALTAELAHKAWELFQQIEADGGMAKVLLSGKAQDMVEKVKAKRETNIFKRSEVIVGTNMYVNPDEKPLEATPAPADWAKKRVEAAKAAKSPDKMAASVAGAADALKNGASLSSVFQAMLSGGEKPTAKALTASRNSKSFEELREATEAYNKKTGANLRVFLANMGPIPKHKARADFIRGFFEVAIFDVIGNDGFSAQEDAVKAAMAAKADVVVICSSDDLYPEIVPALAKSLKEKMPKTKVVLAGLPAEDFQKAYKEAGVDDFVHVRTDCLNFLKSLQQWKGM